MNYFRYQNEHHTLEEMKSFTSGDGGDGGNSGICACETVQELLSNTVWGSKTGVVVILEGRLESRIYDGVRIIPTDIVAEFSISEFVEKIRDESAYDYETL